MRGESLLEEAKPFELERGRMKDYHINIFYSPEDDEYIADIPDLKYCSASGATPEEALHEVLLAKTLWVEAAAEIG